MENIQNLITNIYSKNLVEAKTLFESILHEKCSLTLENAKKEIAKTFLGDGIQEDVGQLDEASNFHAQGAWAALKGKPYSDNPHPKGSTEHSDWSQGHSEHRALIADLKYKNEIAKTNGK